MNYKQILFILISIFSNYNFCATVGIEETKPIHFRLEQKVDDLIRSMQELQAMLDSGDYPYGDIKPEFAQITNDYNKLSKELLESATRDRNYTGFEQVRQIRFDPKVMNILRNLQNHYGQTSKKINDYLKKIGEL